MAHFTAEGAHVRSGRESGTDDHSRHRPAPVRGTLPQLARGLGEEYVRVQEGQNEDEAKAEKPHGGRRRAPSPPRRARPPAPLQGRHHAYLHPHDPARAWCRDAAGAEPWALALALAGLTLVTRWPYRVRLLPTWDAIQFALALERYDVVPASAAPAGLHPLRGTWPARPRGTGGPCRDPRGSGHHREAQSRCSCSTSSGGTSMPATTPGRARARREAPCPGCTAWSAPSRHRRGRRSPPGLQSGVGNAQGVGRSPRPGAARVLAGAGVRQSTPWSSRRPGRHIACSVADGRGRVLSSLASASCCSRRRPGSGRCCG